ncbi:hypothetical protein KUCAC02_022961, partial [Chaenocephalus aceratus]
LPALPPAPHPSGGHHVGVCVCMVVVTGRERVRRWECVHVCTDTLVCEGGLQAQGW